MQMTCNCPSCDDGLFFLEVQIIDGYDMPRSRFMAACQCALAASIRGQDVGAELRQAFPTITGNDLDAIADQQWQASDEVRKLERKLEAKERWADQSKGIEVKP
jgi:hypothetical protein